MATISSLTITGTVSGDATGGSETIAPPVITNSNGSGRVDILLLTSGDNTITPPAGAVGAVITPPANNLVSVLLKKVSGDAGLRLHNTFPLVLAIDPSVATFILNAGTTFMAPLKIQWL